MNQLWKFKSFGPAVNANEFKEAIDTATQFDHLKGLKSKLLEILQTFKEKESAYIEFKSEQECTKNTETAKPLIQFETIQIDTKKCHFYFLIEIIDLFRLCIFSIFLKSVSISSKLLGILHVHKPLSVPTNN